MVAPFLGLPRPGQLVLARAAGNVLVVHRLVDVEMGTACRIYRLQGDAEIAPDTGVLREDLLGRVIAVVRDGRRLPIEDPSFAPPAGQERRARRRRGRRALRAVSLVVTVLLCAFGVVAALAWNTAITQAVQKWIGTDSGRISALFIYALVITAIGVTVIVLLGRLATRINAEPVEFKYPIPPRA